jgi:hypothetical protein
MEHFETSSKKPGRGKARRSLDLIEAMYEIAKAAQPITGRGVGYKLFSAGLIPSMARAEMQRVYRLLREAREQGDIPWEWIVDESRALERRASWSNPEDYARATINDYRRDYWDQQPGRVQVWSEKGTVRGVLLPMLDEYGVGFMRIGGFGSATTVHGLAQDDDGRPLTVFYVGDWDPSGLYMSERDLPDRLDRYDGGHVDLERIALVRDQLAGLPSFPASDKKKDPRYKWFVRNYGQQCWELDALDPNVLRACVEKKIQECIEPVAWERCKVVERAEQESLRTVMTNWRAPAE